MRYRILRNSVRCLKCNSEIESQHRHDFKWCACGKVAVDGGRDYLKRVGSFNDVEDTSITEEIPEDLPPHKGWWKEESP